MGKKRQSGLPPFYSELCSIVGVTDDQKAQAMKKGLPYEEEGHIFFVGGKLSCTQSATILVEPLKGYLGSQVFSKFSGKYVGRVVKVHEYEVTASGPVIRTFEVEKTEAVPSQDEVIKNYISQEEYESNQKDLQKILGIDLAQGEDQTFVSTFDKGKFVSAQPLPPIETGEDFIGKKDAFKETHDLIEAMKTKAAELEAEQQKELEANDIVAEIKCATFGTAFGESTDGITWTAAPSGKPKLNATSGASKLIEAVQFVEAGMMNLAQACSWFNSQLPEGAPYIWPNQMSDQGGNLLNYASTLGDWFAKNAKKLEEEADEATNQMIALGMALAQEEVEAKEVVEVTLTGLTPEEAQKVLKTYAKKTGGKVLASTKKMKDIGTGSKAIIKWEFESSSMVVNGAPVKYIAQLNEDGTLSCQCRGWTQGSAKAATGRFCKHTKAIEEQFDVKTLFKKWKKGESLGDEFVVAGEEEQVEVIKTTATDAPHMTFKSKRVVEI